LILLPDQEMLLCLKFIVRVLPKRFVSAELGFQYTLIPDEAVKETMDFLKKW